MLILTRSEGEAIVMTLPGGEIVSVTVTRVGSDRVRIGTKAPADVAVHRGEVYERLRPPCMPIPPAS